MRRGWRSVFDRHLVEGLTVDERIARLEGTLEGLNRLVALLEERERHRQSAPLFVRLMWLLSERGF